MEKYAKGMEILFFWLFFSLVKKNALGEVNVIQNEFG